MSSLHYFIKSRGIWREYIADVPLQPNTMCPLSTLKTTHIFFTITNAANITASQLLYKDMSLLSPGTAVWKVSLLYWSVLSVMIAAVPVLSLHEPSVTTITSPCSILYIRCSMLVICTMWRSLSSGVGLCLMKVLKQDRAAGSVCLCWPCPEQIHVEPLLCTVATQRVSGFYALLLKIIYIGLKCLSLIG